MTDDTDHAEREDDERAVSLPLIDTFAALEAELSAKETRIERLERELAQRYLDPDGGTQAAAGASGDDAEADVSDPADADDDGHDVSDAGDDEWEPRSHEDWEPATDPLSDTPAASGDADHEGVRPTTKEASEEAEPSEGTEPSEASDANSAESADDSGLKPVRTASTGTADTAERDEDAEASAEETSTREEFGLTMETSSDLTGGSLGSSTDEGFVAGGGAKLNDEETNDGAAANDGDATSEEQAVDDESDSTDGATRPDPTADRGERLSLLVRREELRDEAEVVEAFVRGIEALDDVTQGMLAHYCEAGDAAPVDAHVAAGGSGERQYAYARNRTLRKAGVIEHDGAGRYRYALPDLVAEAFDGSADGQTLDNVVAAIESATGIDE